MALPGTPSSGLPLPPASAAVFSHRPCRPGQHCWLKLGVWAELPHSMELSVRQAGDTGCMNWLPEVLFGIALTSGSSSPAQC